VPLWNRLRLRRAEGDRKVEEANGSLAEAKRVRKEQERKLEQEKESVVKRLDRLAGNDRIAETIILRLREGRR